MDEQNKETLEESDYLRLLLANRDIDLLETQIELLKSKLDSSRRALSTLSGLLKKKYSLSEKDVVDLATGTIARSKESGASVEIPGDA